MQMVRTKLLARDIFKSERYEFLVTDFDAFRFDATKFADR